MINRYLVYGGDLSNLQTNEFANDIEIVGSFTEYCAAQKAWLGASQRTVDIAVRRYFIADLQQVALGLAGPK